jgi:hypothetical protein
VSTSDSQCVYLIFMDVHEEFEGSLFKVHVRTSRRSNEIRASFELGR